MGGVRWERCWKALGGCRCHLSHNLGDLFDQKYGYEQLPLHSLPQREPLTGHIPQEVLARPHQARSQSHPAAPFHAYLMAKSLSGLNSI